jgi:hypothetical protein
MIDSSPGLAAPVAVERRLLVSYDNYPAAQRAVDTLSDAGYAVHNVAIMGNDLRLEETVTGRLTNARAALSGLISGAVFGLVVGLFLGLFTTTTASFIALVLWAVLWGAVMGAAFGFASHAFKGGTRDFTSRSAIVAVRYDVLVPAATLEEARAVLEGGARPADTVMVPRPPSGGPLHAPSRPDPDRHAPGRSPGAGPGTPSPTSTATDQPGTPTPAAPTTGHDGTRPPSPTATPTEQPGTSTRATSSAEEAEEATVAIPMSSVQAVAMSASPDPAEAPATGTGSNAKPGDRRSPGAGDEPGHGRGQDS